MRKKLLLALIIITTISCKKSEKQGIEIPKAELNASSKKDHKSVSETNSKLQKENENLRKLISVLDFSSKSIISDTLANTIYHSLVFENGNDTNATDYQFLYYLSDLVNPNRNNSQSKLNTEYLIKSPSLNSYLHYLWRTVDRSPENIKYLFDQNKAYAYVLLKTRNSYKASGFERTVKILLKSYEEIANDKELLKELNARSNSVGVLSDTIYSKIESQEMKALISGFRDSDFVSYTHWVYSFWARRHKENNAEIVYRIIKEFDNEMSTYSYTEELLEEEDFYEDGF
ncbi:hypothetical protein [Lacinutrix salivirga]